MTSDPSSSIPVTRMTSEELRTELEHFTSVYKFRRPARSLVDETRPWTQGIPNYDIADVLYFRGKSKNHVPGSLEDIVENAVKAWEMEATHLKFADWQTVDHDCYCVSANGGKVFSGEDAAKAGNYNTLMAGADKRLYDSETETFESSHSLFGQAFEGGFPWEVLEVFSGPPKIAYSWRHWAHFTGEFKGRPGDGQKYELYGFGILDVNKHLKVKEIQIFYKENEFLKALHGEIDATELSMGKSLIGSGCPFVINSSK